MASLQSNAGLRHRSQGACRGGSQGPLRGDPLLSITPGMLSCPSETPIFPGPRVSLPQLRPRGLPEQEGGTGPCWALGGAPAQPNQPGRARLQQVSPNPAGEGRSRARRRDPARSLGPSPLRRPRSAAVAPFPELGLWPKAAMRAGETRRERGCVRPRHKGLSSAPPLPSRLLPAGSRSGSHGAGSTALGGGVAARAPPGGHGGRAQPRTLGAPFVNGGKAPPTPRFPEERVLDSKRGSLGSSSGPHPVQL